MNRNKHELCSRMKRCGLNTRNWFWKRCDLNVRREWKMDEFVWKWCDLNVCKQLEKKIKWRWNDATWMFVNKEMGFRRNSFGTMVKFAWLIWATANRQNNTWKYWLWTRHRASPECFALCVLNYPSTGYLDCFANGVQCLCKQLTAGLFSIFMLASG